MRVHALDGEILNTEVDSLLKQRFKAVLRVLDVGFACISSFNHALTTSTDPCACCRRGWLGVSRLSSTRCSASLYCTFQ